MIELTENFVKLWQSCEPVGKFAWITLMFGFFAFVFILIDLFFQTIHFILE